MHHHEHHSSNKYNMLSAYSKGALIYPENFDPAIDLSPLATGTADWIQALADLYNWTGTLGQAATVNYSYDISFENGTRLTDAEITAAEQALQAWENVANVNFTRGSGSAADTQLAFSQLAMTDYSGLFVPLSVSGITLQRGEIQLNADYASHDYTAGSWGYWTLLHEVGHALGLKHPGNYNDFEYGPFLTSAEDYHSATVMSYNEGNTPGLPISPMIYDIAAVQHFYGANTSYNAGDSAYILDGSTTSMTIWDGGGTDMLYTALAGDAVLDLREGLEAMSSVGNQRVWVAFNASIENAISGSGNDTLYGNSLANTLTAGGGSDTVTANSGNDTVYANAGADIVYGNTGTDTLYGNMDNDTVYGGQDNDAVYGNLADDALFGNLGNDVLYGGQGNDSMHGGQGEDTLSGGVGNDTCTGGLGNDVYVISGEGNDIITDFLNPGSTAGDTVQLSASLVSSAQQVLSLISYADNNAAISLGSSVLTLIGVAAGSLTADDFTVV